MSLEFTSFPLLYGVQCL